MPFLFVTDIRMTHDPADGTIKAEHPTGHSGTWAPFVDAGGQLTLLARESEAPGDVTASGPGIRLVTVPNYRSLAQVARGVPQILLTVVRESRDKVLVLRLLEPLSLMAGTVGLVLRRPMIVWIVNDPPTLIASYGPFMSAADRMVKVITRRAEGVIYLADDKFRRRYAAGEHAEVLINSNVDVTEEAITHARSEPHDPEVVRFITIGSNQTAEKGQEVILDALSLLAPRMRFTMEFVGGGRMIPHFEQRARELGIDDRVSFVGLISDRSELYARLDAADVFLLPSYAEGLPRVITEAQARGLPVIASNVGSIASQVPSRQVLPDITAAALADTIETLLSTAGEYSTASAAGLEAARRNIALAAPDRMIAFLRRVQAKVGASNT